MSRRPVPVILCVLYLLCSGAAGIFAAPSVAVSAVLGTPTTGNLERILDAAPSSAGSPAPGVYRWDLFPDVLVVADGDSVKVAEGERRGVLL